MKIGVIGALEAEVRKLKSLMKNVTVTEKYGLNVCEGTLCGKEVVVVKSGMGKVNAASCTQLLICMFGVTHLINTGVGGCLCEDINIGDIVLSTDVVQHDFNLSPLGFSRGLIPALANVKKGGPSASPFTCFPADESLLSLALQAWKTVSQDIGIHKGRIVTGDQFIHERSAREDLANTFEGVCCEMEGGAIAQVACTNRIPFLIIRAISDKADGSATKDYQAFENAAIEHYIGLIIEMLKNM